MRRATNGGRERGTEVRANLAHRSITGTSSIPRTAASVDPSSSNLDPRFDPDDLRQGKPPPAARGHPHLSSVGKLPGQALKLPGHALRVPGKGLKRVKRIVVGKDGKEKEVEEEVEVGEEGQEVDGADAGAGAGGEEEAKHGGGFFNKVLHPHGHGHK